MIAALQQIAFLKTVIVFLLLTNAFSVATAGIALAWLRGDPQRLMRRILG